MVDRFPRISVSQLAVGMFVTDLDRPWLDTPFIVQGVLVESAEDLQVFRDLCRYVYIDPLRSTVQIRFVNSNASQSQDRNAGLKHGKATQWVIVDQSDAPAVDGKTPGDPTQTQLPGVSLNSSRAGNPFRSSAANGPAGVVRNERSQPAPAKTEATVKADPSSAELDARVVALREGAEGRVVASAESVRKLANAISRLEVRVASLGNAKTPESTSTPLPQTLIPATVSKLVEYPDERPIEAELPRAQQTLASTAQTLERIIQDIELGNTLHMDKVQQTSNDLVDSVVANPDAMMWVARLRNVDKKTYAHGLRVAVYLLALGRHMGFPRNELRNLGMIGMLIDVGKVRVPRELLDKRGKLTHGEFEEIKRHVDYGLEILQGTRGVSREVLEGIAQHHERMKGQGYPHGLRDHQISVYGRMAGLADCFAALVSPRPYAEAMAPSDSMLRLFEWSGEYFHPALVERFVQAIGVFPVGTLVELSTGHIGVVLRHNRLRRLQPKLLLLTDSHKKPRAEPMEVDLLRDGARADGEPVRIVRGLPAGAFGLDVDGYTASAQPAMLG